MKIDRVSLHSDRFLPEDRARILARQCIHQTGYGLPGMTFCLAPLSDEEMSRGSVECAEHEGDATDHGYAVLRLDANDSA